mmetsp:Transcript_9623/g.16804  ORF Transcript_9623/g.16804 Transcript_9623/m.16804 type:complete len:249 (+) Transcript_9623:219-965(+)
MARRRRSSSSPSFLRLERGTNIFPPTPAESDAAFCALRISEFVHCVRLSTWLSTFDAAETCWMVDMPSLRGAMLVRKESRMVSMTSSILLCWVVLLSPLELAVRFRDAMLDGTWMVAVFGVAVVGGGVVCDCCRVVVVDPCCDDFLPRRLNPDADFFAGFDGTLFWVDASFRSMDFIWSVTGSLLFSCLTPDDLGATSLLSEDCAIVPSFPQGKTLRTFTLYKGFSHRFFSSGGSYRRTKASMVPSSS